MDPGSALNRLTDARRAKTERMRSCQHDWRETPWVRPYMYPVNPTDPNPAAHGGIHIRDACSRCGATRDRLVNGGHEELGDARMDIPEIDQQIARLEAKVSEDEMIARAEKSAWCGDTLSVPGKMPVEVRIAVIEDVGEYVIVSIDGEAHGYSLAQLARAPDQDNLDEGQRMAWALIARRARAVYEAAQR